MRVKTMRSAAASSRSRRLHAADSRAGQAFSGVVGLAAGVVTASCLLAGGEHGPTMAAALVVFPFLICAETRPYRDCQCADKNRPWL